MPHRFVTRSPSASPKTCPNFRGSRFLDWSGCWPSASGAVLSCVLPRIRRSPCETDSAAMKRERKGTVESPSHLTGARGGRVGGARWDDWLTGCHPWLAAEHRDAASTATSSGGSATDVPPSAANGAAVEPMRALMGTPDFSGPGAPGLARDRGGDLPGAAPSEAQRPASRSVRQARPVHAQREGSRARDPRAMARAAACFSRHRRLGCVA